MGKNHLSVRMRTMQHCFELWYQFAGGKQAICDVVRIGSELEVSKIFRCSLDTKKPIICKEAQITDVRLNVSLSAPLGVSSHLQSHLTQLLILCIDPFLYFNVRCEKPEVQLHPSTAFQAVALAPCALDRKCSRL